MSEQVYLLFGKTGWLGGKLTTLLREQGKTVHLADSRLENRESVLKEIETIKPTHVLNAAGVTGRPNVDWCESNRPETVRANVIGTLNLADICSGKGIHCTVYATGCIYEYDAEHTIGGKGFLESDPANFKASFYSFTKGMVENMLKVFPNVCILRVRMPISDDLSPRNFVTKIVKYEKVVNIPNSMTVLTDLLPVSLAMADKKLEMKNPRGHPVFSTFPTNLVNRGHERRECTTSATREQSATTKFSTCTRSTSTPPLPTPTSRWRSRTRSWSRGDRTTPWVDQHRWLVWFFDHAATKNQVLLLHRESSKMNCHEIRRTFRRW
ncbi:unnamed protein product [Pylaiella littoralis]